jgi:NTP pyrophosphatase (non-canonical NTP hydrolase)
MKPFKWTQEKITRWAQSQFGVVPPLGIATRMNLEVAELLDALNNGNVEEAIKEVADVEIMLRQVAETLGVTLDVEVEKKMNVNEARQWRKTASGSYQHVD